MSNINEKVINVLTEIYWAEIGAVGIYMDQHTKCVSLGYNKLAELLEKDAVDEMKHAEGLAERIIFIGGRVYNQKHIIPKEQHDNDIVDMLNINIDIEIEAINRFNKGIEICFNERDNGSRMLLEEYLKSEESHLGKLQNMQYNISKYGDQYIVTHLM